MFDKIEKVLTKVDIVMKWLTVVCLGGMTLAIFLQVIFRYVLNAPLAWTEELSVFMFIWMTFLAGYLGARRDKHIGVEGIKNALPLLGFRALDFIGNAVSAIFFTIIVISTISFLPKLMTQISPALGIPMAFVYLIMIIGSVLMGFWYAVLSVKSFTKQKS